MDPRQVERYLAGKLGDEVRVSSLSQAFPGLSRETWLVRLERGPAGSAIRQGVVIRADTAGGPVVPTPLEYEYQVYVHVAKTDIPVARPLWFDASPEITDGRALFVREMVEGSTLLPGLGDDTAAAAERRRRVAIEHIENLARLHRVDWRSAGFGNFMDVPGCAEDVPRHELERWRRVWEEVRPAPLPVVTEALHWFADHLPARAANVSLCKGQNGIGEEIWRDDRLVAFCDWELANIGDPCQDLALSQGMLKLWDRDRLVAHYERVAGFSLPPDNISYYIVWNAFKSMLSLGNGLNSFLDGRYRRLARATLGYGKVKVYEHLLGAIIRLDLPSAAQLVMRGQPSPYHNKKVAGG
jgi:aminoglycoside phosphotransferase (APT) family kinase protein